MLRTRRLTVELGGATVLDDVSLEVARGEWVAVVGPNGAGKSTFLRAVIALVPSRGEIELAGRPLARLDRRARARQVAFVAQSPAVPPGMTVAEYVLLGRTPHLRPLGVESADDLAVADEVLRRLELRHVAQRGIDTLSGGEQQRVRIARALAQDAPLLLLDEPTTALDVGHQQEVLELVDELRRDRDLTVVTTLHDLTLAAQYADRLVLLDRGRAVAAGSPESVLTEDNLARFSGARVRVVRDGDAIVIVPVRWERVDDVDDIDDIDGERIT
jgi:iron complex transport system ATP-binding protein